MKSRSVPVVQIVPWFMIFFVQSLAAPRAESPPPADLVLRRGAVYTLDGARSWAESVAVSGGRIVAVGPDGEIAARIGPRTRQIELEGQMVLPGFHDAHVHPMAGIHDIDCQLAECVTPDQVREALRRFAKANPEKPWVRGQGWALPLFPQGNPHKKLIDDVIPDRPAYLVANDGHSAWVNSKALEVAGIGKDTPDPPNGHIERDPKTGEPTGTLREQAMSLVSQYLPKASLQERVEGLRRGLDRATRSGITSIQDADVSAETLEAYAALQKQGALSVRVVAAIHADPEAGEQQLPRMRALRKEHHSPRLRADAVKIFVDGVIDSRTAALLEPYVGSADFRGKAIWSPESLNRFVIALDRDGFQVHIHAIGDRGIRMALDAFETARSANGVRDSRHHIAHAQLIDPADIPRFRRLGVIANFQPLWAQADSYILTLTQPLLGPHRSRWLYPIASVAQTGAVVVFGSDWPVTTINPLEIIQVAITRRDAFSGPGPAWIPEERIGLAPALAASTIQGAYLDFRDRETGSIEVGKAADLILLDRNLFDVPPHQIHQAKLRMTLVDGVAVFEDRAEPDHRN